MKLCINFFQGSRNRFLIEFDRTKKGRDLRMQETALHDMIALNDALRHNVVADDKVVTVLVSNFSIQIVEKFLGWNK